MFLGKVKSLNFIFFVCKTKAIWTFFVKSLLVIIMRTLPFLLKTSNRRHERENVTLSCRKQNVFKLNIHTHYSLICFSFSLSSFSIFYDKNKNITKSSFLNLNEWKRWYSWFWECTSLTAFWNLNFKEYRNPTDFWNLKIEG